MSKNITAAAIAIARNHEFLTTEPNGSAKGRPGTFIEALACLPDGAKFIGYTPVHGLNPLTTDKGGPLGPTLFSLAAIKNHAALWEAQFRRMRGAQWRVVTVDGQTFIINVHSRRPVEFRAAALSDERYPITIDVWGDDEGEAPASREPEQVSLFGPDGAGKPARMAMFNTGAVDALIDQVVKQGDEFNALKRSMTDSFTTVFEAGRAAGLAAARAELAAEKEEGEGDYLFHGEYIEQPEPGQTFCRVLLTGYTAEEYGRLIRERGAAIRALGGNIDDNGLILAMVQRERAAKDAPGITPKMVAALGACLDAIVLGQEACKVGLELASAVLDPETMDDEADDAADRMLKLSDSSDSFSKAFKLVKEAFGLTTSATSTPTATATDSTLN